MEEKFRPKGFIEIPNWTEKHNTEVEWWTPPEVFQKLNIEFDIDVASPKGGVDWIPAKKYFTKEDNGLEQEWQGTVWMNPPYGRFTGSWLDKFIEHNNGIALVFSRTETQWFHNYALKADALSFTKGRFAFYKNGIKGDSAAVGSLFIACGDKAVNALEKSGLGWFIKL